MRRAETIALLTVTSVSLSLTQASTEEVDGRSLLLRKVEQKIQMQNLGCLIKETLL